MSAEAITYALLTGAGAVTSIVAATDIWPVVLPQPDKVPAIVYSLVSAVREPAIDAQAPTHLTRARVQVDLLSKDYGQLRTLRDAVVAAMQFQRGAIAGFTVHTVLHAGEQPVDFDEKLELYHRPIDFLIFYQQ